MLSFNELYEQKHRISELSKVLLHVIEDRSLCDLNVTCDLFFQYTTEVKKHLDLEERELYKDMLTHRDEEVNELAKKYLSGSTEIKHVMKDYLKHWCRNKSLRIKNHERFIEESKEVFELVNIRIYDEVEHLYPVLRKIQDIKIAA